MSRPAVAAAFRIMVLAAAASAAPAETEILERAPADPDPSARYLFYLHGRIIETQGPEAVSPIFGRYEYHRILGALTEKGFVVVAEVREDGAGQEFVEDTAAQIMGLLEGGVPPGHVTVVGFSKGGGLALGVSTLVANDQVGFAILAGCGSDPAWARELGPRLRGRFLSLYDSSDRLSPSCQGLFAHAKDVEQKDEHVFESGLDHGHFYAPRPDWVDLVASFAR